MKRQELIDIMLRISNRKMEIELILSRTPGIHVTAEGQRYYFRCCYYLGVAREKLRELDRKRNIYLRNRMKRRQNEKSK